MSSSEANPRVELARSLISRMTGQHWGVVVVCGMVVVGFALAVNLGVLPGWFLVIIGAGVLATFYNGIQALRGVVCGRGRNPTLRLWPAIFSGEIDVFPSERRNMGQEIGR